MTTLINQQLEKKIMRKTEYSKSFFLIYTYRKLFSYMLLEFINTFCDFKTNQDLLFQWKIRKTHFSRCGKERRRYRRYLRRAAPDCWEIWDFRSHALNFPACYLSKLWGKKKGSLLDRSSLLHINSVCCLQVNTWIYTYVNTANK